MGQTVVTSIRSGDREASKAGGSTLVEKIIARAASRRRVAPGELVTAEVDFAFAHDSSGPRRWQPLLDQLGTGLRDARKIAIVSDHYVPAVDPESVAILETTRRFAKKYGVEQFFDMQGICHVVLPERGLIRPGAFIAGGDSHTPTAGAFGAYAAGYGATDMAAIVATGRTWLTVPDTLSVTLDGQLPYGVVAKDVMLKLCLELGLDNAGMAIEYRGTALAAMSMEERMVLCNMAAELGAETGIVAPDATTFEWFRTVHAPVPVDEAEAIERTLFTEIDAPVGRRHRLDTASLAPQVAAPHSPANVRDADRYADIRIDQAYIGACVGAKLGDLRMAASVLSGRTVAGGVRLLVAPASSRITAAAAADGTLKILLDAGAVLLPSGCGACAGMGAGLLGDGDVCISSTNRNFRGRMGHENASVYLASPLSVAAAAVAGRIVDPRDMLPRSDR